VCGFIDFSNNLRKTVPQKQPKVPNTTILLLSENIYRGKRRRPLAPAIQRLASE